MPAIPAMPTVSDADRGERSVLPAAGALAVAVGVFGISFGVLAVAAGASVWQTSAMSLTVFAGGAQFAAVGVTAAGGAPVAGVAAGLLLNTRYAAFGLAVAPALGPLGLLRRLVAAHLLIDESAALALSQLGDPDNATARRRARLAFWATGLGVYLTWNLGTFLGAVAGGVLADPTALGLDAAFPAGFLALLAPQLRDRRGVAAAVMGGILAVATTPLLPPGVPVLVAALGAIAALRLPARAAPR